MEQQRGLDFGQPAQAAPKRRVFTVTALTERILGALETEFFDLWVEGEISNLRLAGSGHWYFSLKDENAQIRAVVWKTATRLIKWKPKDGMKVVVRGGVRGYAQRGEYQLSVEVVEPLGKGSLQQAFEDLKEKLGQEGLFEAARKRPLPVLPRRIGIVTSPDGAVLRDIVRVLAQRHAGASVLVYPARVQGEEASAEIVQGIRTLNKFKTVDVIIVARGGGSLEDLWPFNEERVARALAASRVPTIAAVGHETDFTIADFVADLRAPTPSAAAERVVQAKDDLCAHLDHLARRLEGALRLRFERLRSRLSLLSSHRVFEAERGRLRASRLAVAELRRRAQEALSRRLERSRLRVMRAEERVEGFRLDRQLALRRERLQRAEERLALGAASLLHTRRTRLAAQAGRLESLSPLGVLSRGYALAFAADGRLLRSPADVEVGAALRVRLQGGELRATVTSKEQP